MVFTLFRNKEVQSEPVLLALSKEKTPKVEVERGSDLEIQLKMLVLEDTDFAVAQVLKPYVDEHIGTIINDFYHSLTENDLLNRVQGEDQR